MPNLFVGSIGEQIILNVGLDISTATNQEIRYKRPNGTVGRWDAELYDGQSIVYVTKTEDDLNLPGTWELQSYVELPDWSGYGDIASVVVYDKLQEGQY